MLREVNHVLCLREGATHQQVCTTGDEVRKLHLQTLSSISFLRPLLTPPHLLQASPPPHSRLHTIALTLHSFIFIYLSIFRDLSYFLFHSSPSYLSPSSPLLFCTFHLSSSPQPFTLSPPLPPTFHLFPSLPLSLSPPLPPLPAPKHLGDPLLACYRVMDCSAALATYNKNTEKRQREK